jgi:hypothetical protein
MTLFTLNITFDFMILFSFSYLFIYRIHSIVININILLLLCLFLLDYPCLNFYFYIYIAWIIHFDMLIIWFSAYLAFFIIIKQFFQNISTHWKVLFWIKSSRIIFYITNFSKKIPFSFKYSIGSRSFVFLNSLLWYLRKRCRIKLRLYKGNTFVI